MASTKVLGRRIRCHVIKIWPMGTRDFWREGTWHGSSLTEVEVPWKEKDNRALSCFFSHKKQG